MNSRSATWPIPFWHNVLPLGHGASDAAADQLIAALWPDAYRIAFSVVRDRSLAEDAAQEACAAVYRGIHTLRAPKALNVWFYRIVVRKALAIRRKEASFAQLSPANSQCDVAAVDSELKMDVLRALAKITPRQRAIVALHYYAQLNSREIGAILGIPDGTVRFHIMKTKRLLARLLANHAGFDFDEEEG